MRELAHFAEEHGLHSFAKNLVEENAKTVVGVSVTYSRDVVYSARSRMPSWLRTWDALGTIAGWPARYGGVPKAYSELTSKYQARIWNTYWRDSFQIALADCRRYQQPLFELIIYRKPGTPNLSRESTSSAEIDHHALIRFEERTEPVLQRRSVRDPICRVGSTVSPARHPNLHGTIGGVARDRATGQLVAVTAAHIFDGEVGQLVGLGAPRRASPWYRAISSWTKSRGEVRGRLRASSPLGTWVASTPRQQDGAANVDTCIILPENDAMGAQSLRVRARDDAMFGEMMVFAGATSGRVSARLGPYGLYFGFRDLAGVRRTYGDLIDLRFGEEGPRMSPSRGGDSGAWVVTDDDEWYASILGADHLTSFCTRADLTMRYWSDQGVILD